MKHSVDDLVRIVLAHQEGARCRRIEAWQDVMDDYKVNTETANKVAKALNLDTCPERHEP